MSKILIVDDSETMRVQLRRDLEAAGFQVIEGSDGVHGLETLKANPDINLVLSDVNMPRMDGLEMTKRIHEIADFKKLPVLVLTTEVSADLKTKGKEAGVLAWVTKPYVTGKLIPVLQKVLTK